MYMYAHSLYIHYVCYNMYTVLYMLYVQIVQVYMLHIYTPHGLIYIHTT